jgi:DNA helicase HerA-like ATPase
MPSEKVRISILNFIGLVGLEQQQQFLNQLAMTLFTWIKKNPAPSDRPLRGLLVIDEAKDFVPSKGSTPCKASINRLVAQARKYGLGIIFATQAPKSIDHNIIANCSTQFYGRANSPAAIDVIKEQLIQRGGTGQDTSKLPKGQFYVFSESINPPIKVATPLCLSCHPATPPDESEVIKRAKTSRNSIATD